MKKGCFMHDYFVGNPYESYYRSTLTGYGKVSTLPNQTGKPYPQNFLENTSWWASIKTLIPNYSAYLTIFLSSSKYV